ncbi:class B sortase [Collinsella aerofaciens]|uniref:class B sortase n=1 Tax=Collinsella aerofaciens TaxID=74426 RepID=UPI002331048B|nr:class B sortase [Collinsella aerofaciens]MDB1855475.1 class B sortase [Collinsella aerofaciens]
MSDYQGKRFKASQIPDPSKPGAAHAAQQGRTSSPQQPRAPRPVTPATHRRQDAPAAYRPSSYSTAKKPSRSSSHAAPSDYTEPPRKKRRSVIPILLIIIGIGLIVAAAAIFINAQIGYKQASESYQKIEKQYAPAKDASGVPVIDFDALAQTNPEVVGWIYARGTNINYPVVQCKDNNSKYLNTLFDGTSNASGAIFLDYEDTAPGMVDQQTTIYGHHMNDGSMFNVISDTTDQATFDSIEFVYYITRDATYKLRPLATKVVEDTYAKARTPNFEGDDGLKNYLSEMLDGASAVASDATDRAASATKVVTLVTCRSLSLSNTRAVMVLTPVEE